MKNLISIFLVLLGFQNLFASADIQKDSIAGANKKIVFRIDLSNKKQQIRNIGASGCWFSEPIGKYWPQEKKERIAELLFSTAFDANGVPKGIGLSCWRFNVGGGTAEQGDSSGISDPNKRVECFMNPDGTYNWNKQEGYQWFLRKAVQYKVDDLIAFSNTPPVYFNQNGRGFKTNKDRRSNLLPDKYDAYGIFLADVLQHFEQEKIHFNYISPINEPQWEWYGEVGKAKQEGSPWTNKEIFNVIGSVDKALTNKNLQTKILTTEAAQLDYLYGKEGPASHQVTFWQKNSPLSLANDSHVPKIAGGHSYFTDGSDNKIFSVRKNLYDTLQKSDPELEYWQTEYCLLGNGYKEGKEKASAMDCGLFLAKIIYFDFTAGNASAWQYWNAYEPGDYQYDTRYYLIALKPNKDFRDGEFYSTKNLFALGHYSRFIRPGMYRLEVQRSDDQSGVSVAQGTMVSSYVDEKSHRLVSVAINYSHTPQTIKIDAGKTKFKKVMGYLTTADANENLKPVPMNPSLDKIQLPSRSLMTIVTDYK